MKTNARNEMSRFGFCQNQEPHPIFHRLARLRNTVAPSRRVEREIEAIEREIEQSMDDAERDAQKRMDDAERDAWQREWTKR